jgi:hypothetical protein
VVLAAVFATLGSCLAVSPNSRPAATSGVVLHPRKLSEDDRSLLKSIGFWPDGDWMYVLENPLGNTLHVTLRVACTQLPSPASECQVTLVSSNKRIFVGAQRRSELVEAPHWASLRLLPYVFDDTQYQMGFLSLGVVREPVEHIVSLDHSVILDVGEVLEFASTRFTTPIWKEEFEMNDNAAPEVSRTRNVNVVASVAIDQGE